MIRFLLHFKKTFGVVFVALTILWLPKDIADYDEALASWRKFIGVIEREQALWVLLFILVGWLFWTELRPLIREWRRPKTDFGVVDDLAKVSHPVEDDNGNKVDNFYENRFYLIVKNERLNRTTIRNVKARAFLMGKQVDLLERGQNNQFDLRVGEYFYFEIGRSYNFESCGHIEFPKSRLSKDIVKGYKHNAQLEGNYGCLHVFGKDGTEKCGMGQYDGRTVPFWVVITGDDCEPLEVKLDYDLAELDFKKKGVWITSVGDKRVAPENPNNSFPLPDESVAEKKRKSLWSVFFDRFAHLRRNASA